MDSTLEENGFETLGLREEILSSLKKAGFLKPSPIQQEVIPLILSGIDVIGQAQTGTGKTAAFALPALSMLKNTGTVEVLVITPTRELTSQVSEEIQKLGWGVKAKVATVYGGKSFFTQIEAIKRGAHVVVATPGRLLDLLQSGKAAGLKPWLVVVDEADEMLDMGFLEDIQAIFELLPEERQTLLFSATMPAPIQTLAKKVLKNPTIVKAASTQTSNADIAQSYCLIADSERDEAVIRLFEAQEMDKAILFCKTKKEVDRLSQVLNTRGHAASALHGDMEQNQRESVIHGFRAGKSRILVATDVAARGLNIVDVTHVINFHIPYDAENYVHRIGRTGRAGRKGASLTLVTSRELGKLLHFQQKAGGSFERAYIPSKQEIRKSQVKRLIAQITAQTPAQETSELINAIGDDTDITTIAGKLLSLILSQNPIDGPDSIGVSENEPMKKAKKYAGSSGSKSFGRRENRGEWRERRGDRPSRSSDRPAGAYSRPERSFDRPAGAYSKPERSFDRPARPERSFDRPAGAYSKPERSFGSFNKTDRPAGSYPKTDRPFGSFPKKKFAHPSPETAKTPGTGGFKKKKY